MYNGLIICAGMRRAVSTWQYDIARDLVLANGGDCWGFVIHQNLARLVTGWAGKPLRSLVEPPEALARPASAGLVGILPVRVPGHQERPQLITWAGPGELRIDEYLRWAEPIDAGVTRTLAENLDALLPAHSVIRSPWPAAIVPFCRVRVDLRVFGPQESGDVRLEGRWMLLPGKGERPLAHRSTSLQRGPLPAGPSGIDAAAGVEAMSALLAELAKEIAAAVEALGPLGSG